MENILFISNDHVDDVINEKLNHANLIKIFLFNFTDFFHWKIIWKLSK